MRILPTITFEQYRDTYSAVAAAKVKRSETRSWRYYLSVAILCLAVGVSAQVPAARAPVFTLFGELALLVILAKPLAKRSQEKHLRAHFFEEQDLFNGQILMIDESGISCDFIHGQVTSYFTWTAIKKFVDMSDAYVFLTSPNSFIRVPKDLLSSLEAELILQWSSSVPKHLTASVK